MLLTNLTSQDYFFGPLHLAAGNGSTLTVDDTTATSLYLTDDSVADAINTLVASNKITQTGAAPPFPRPTGEPEVLHGDGSPEGLVYAGQGSIYLRRDNSGGTQMYQKSTGIHINSGWLGLVGAAITTPTGAIFPYGGAAAPGGWLLCDGSAVSRSTYSDLFSALGTAYGSGDGSTTFNVPDLQGRAPIGKGTHADVSALGNNDGVVTLANRRPKHRHSPHTHTQNAHAHTIQASNTVAAFNAGSPEEPYGNGSITGSGSTDNATATNQTADGGSGNANDSLDAPAYLVVNYIIKT